MAQSCIPIYRGTEGRYDDVQRVYVLEKLEIQNSNISS